MACGPTSATPDAPTACCEPKARTRPPPAPRELVGRWRGLEGPSRLPCLSIRLGRTKTTEADDDVKALMIGPPVVAIKAWIARTKIGRGPVFRAIDRWGTLEERALSPQSVSRIVKRRCVAAGFNPRELSAHGLRSGYLIEAARQGVPMPEAVHQSQHCSVQQAVSYNNDADGTKGWAARLAV